MITMKTRRIVNNLNLHIVKDKSNSFKILLLTDKIIEVLDVPTTCLRELKKNIVQFAK